MCKEVEIGLPGVRILNREVLVRCVGRRRDRTFWHVLDAFSRVDDAAARPETVEDVEEEAKGGRGRGEGRGRGAQKGNSVF